MHGPATCTMARKLGVRLAFLADPAQHSDLQLQRFMISRRRKPSQSRNRRAGILSSRYRNGLDVTADRLTLMAPERRGEACTLKGSTHWYNANSRVRFSRIHQQHGRSITAEV